MYTRVVTRLPLKYVHKGCDQATFALHSDQVDGISEYQNAFATSAVIKQLGGYWSTRHFLLFNNLLYAYRIAIGFISL